MDTIAQARRVLQIEGEAILALQDQLNSDFEKAVSVINQCHGKVIVTAVGKSGHIGSKIAATLASTGTPAFFVHPTEAYHGDLGMISDKDIVLAISNSGSSIEILNIVPMIKKIGATIISITSNPESLLAQHSEISLIVKVDKEADSFNLAPTASTTATLAFGDALAVTLLKMKKFQKEDFAFLHPGGFLGSALLRVKEIMHKGGANPVIEKNVPLKQAIIESSESNLGAITIVDENMKVAGILTDGDIRRVLKNFDGDRLLSTLSEPVENIMVKKPYCVNENEFCQKVVMLMEKKSTYVLPVVDDSNIAVGMIRMHDLVQRGFSLKVD